MSFGNGSLAVSGDAPDAVITGAVSRAGYRAHPAARDVVPDDSPFWRRDARALSTTVAVALLAVAVTASLAAAPRVVSEEPVDTGRLRALTIPVVTVPARPSGLPTAMTGWPTTRASESPMLTGVRSLGGF